MWGLAIGFGIWVLVIIVAIAFGKAASKPRPHAPTWEERFDEMMGTVLRDGVPYPPDEDE